MSFTSQVGSVGDTVDYDVQNHVGFISGTFAPHEAVKIDFGVSYAHAKAKADDPRFGRPFVLTSGTISPDYNTDFSEMNEFSDLKLGILEFSAGCELQLRRNLRLRVQGVLRNVEDEDPYLEEHDGTVYGASVGLIYAF